MLVLHHLSRLYLADTVSHQIYLKITAPGVHMASMLHIGVILYIQYRRAILYIWVVHGILYIWVAHAILHIWVVHGTLYTWVVHGILYIWVHYFAYLGVLYYTHVSDILRWQHPTWCGTFRGADHLDMVLSGESIIWVWYFLISSISVMTKQFLNWFTILYVELSNPLLWLNLSIQKASFTHCYYQIN